METRQYICSYIASRTGATSEVAAVNLILMSDYCFFALDEIIKRWYIDIVLCCYITGESFLSNAEEASKQFLLALDEYNHLKLMLIYIIIVLFFVLACMQLNLISSSQSFNHASSLPRLIYETCFKLQCMDYINKWARKTRKKWSLRDVGMACQKINKASSIPTSFCNTWLKYCIYCVPSLHRESTNSLSYWERGAW